MLQSEKKKISFYDVDGTILDCQSQQLFLSFMKRKGYINLPNYLLILFWFIGYKLGIFNNPEKVMERAFHFLTDWPEDKLNREVSLFYREILSKHKRKDVCDILKREAETDHKIILLSNAFGHLVKPLGEDLGADSLVCTELEVANGFISGRVLRPMYGKFKKKEVDKMLINREEFEVWAYSDHISDLPVLDTADHPTAVYPSRQLKQIALNRRWPIIGIK